MSLEAIPPLVRLLRRLALLLLLQAAPAAQIVAVHFADEDGARKFRRELVEIGGQKVLVGELEKVHVDAVFGAPWPEKLQVDLILMDQKRPTKVPYEPEGGEREGLRSGNLITIPGNQVARIDLLEWMASLNSVALELEYREERLEAVKKSPRRRSKDPDEKVLHELLVLTELEEMRSFARRVGLVELTEDLGKDVRKGYDGLLGKPLARGGPDTFARADRMPPSDDLRASAREISGNPDLFHVLESHHVRLIHDGRIPDDQAFDFLELAETVIEGFRRQLVLADPTGGADRIPERILSEFFLGPDSDREHELYFEEHFGFSWGDGGRRQEQLAMRSKYEIREEEPEFFTYTRYREGMDILPEYIHVLGHHLIYSQFAHRPWTEDGRHLTIPWLVEAGGYRLALEYLGRNDYTCTGFDSTYRGNKEYQLAQSPFESYRGYAQRLALDSGRNLNAIAVAAFSELDVRDVAKSWSLLDYLLTREGGKGHEFLHLVNACTADATTFQQRWIDGLRELYGVEQGNPVAWLESGWRAALEEE